MSQTLSAPPRHRFVLELLAPDGRRLHDAALEKEDFARAVEATFFEALRRGSFRDYAPPTDQARVEPAFAGHGPLASGFEIVLPTPAGEARQRFGLSYFKTFARRTGAQLAVGGTLDPAATVLFRLTAFPEGEVPRKPGLAIDLEAEPTTIPIREGSRRQLGVTEAWDSPRPGDFPVVFPRHVLEDSVQEARRKPDREVGGALLGHLRRDRESGELYLEVTALVRCEETEATSLSVTFTHETWARVREVVAWRGEGELIVGWMHSHPFRLCAECPSPVPAECQAKVLFYSTDDEFLMELTFARPFMVGLLAAVEPRLEQALGHLPVKLFGWRNAGIAARGFEVSDG
jgi:proteasome lid subunit RPN8/RPN11